MNPRLLLVALSFLMAGCSGVQDPLNPAGPQAGTIARLTWWFFGVCAVVYVLTMTALVAALWRRRSPLDDGQEMTRRLTRAIVSAVGATVVTLLGLSVYSVLAGRGLTDPSGPGAVNVEVLGQQWWWEFRYDDVTPSNRVNSPNELHIPVGVPITLRAASLDVIHSFWAPNLQGKRDLIPGMVTHMWLQADTPGVYRGQCAEFCGHQHAHMAFLVVAQPMSEYLAWLQAQRRGAPEPRTARQRRGHDLFLTGTCATCHTVRGTPAGSHVGPDLTHVASRETLAAGTLPMTRDRLAAWIVNPHAFKPGTRMPPSPLAAADLEALLDYLETLQ